MLTCHLLAFTIVWGSVRITGTAAYGLALLACLAVVIRCRGQRGAWALITGVFFLMLIDTVWNIRHELSPVFSGFLNPEQYAQRRSVQYAVLVAGLLGWGLTTALIIRKAKHRPTRLAVTGASLALACSFASLISYHHLDAITYASLGPLPLIAWLWCLASLLAIGGAALKLKTSEDKNGSAA